MSTVQEVERRNWPSVERTPTGFHVRGKAILGAAMLFMAAAVVSPVEFAKLTFLLVSGVLVMAAIAVGFGPRLMEIVLQLSLMRHVTILRYDPLPVVVVSKTNRILYANAVAERALAARKHMSALDVLSTVMARPERALSDVMAGLQKAPSYDHKIKRLSGDIDVHAVRLSAWLTALRINLADTEKDSADAAFPAVIVDPEGTVLQTNPAARSFLGPHAESISLFCPNPPLRLGDINDVRTANGLSRCFVHEKPSTEKGREIILIPVPDMQTAKSDTWSILEDLPVAMLRLSSGGLIELSNRPARVILGVESGAGRRMSELLDGPGRPLVDWLRDAVDGRGTVQPEILQMRRKDKDVFVQVALNPVREGSKTVLIAVLQDATKLKSLELQFVQSQKMQAIGQLAGGVAHDFNNLLTAISGHCDLLLMRHGVDDPTYPDLMQISQNANRAAALVGQLLAYSRKQMLRLEIMSLRDMLSDLTHLLNRLVGEKVTLTLDHDPDLWQVRADKRQLEQVLMNLVVNARDAMSEGGQVVIRTKNLRLDKPLTRDRAKVAPGLYVVVSVEDNGSGISPDLIEKVFEPFYTSKKQGEGTGLGLSTAYGIVKQTGGFIFVDSQIDHGTTFQIYLPAHTMAPARNDLERPTRIIRPHVEGVVMLVEDEAPVRAFASRALKMRGFSVIEASSGEEALALLQDDALNVDVIVTDVVMPGLDGPTWVNRALQSRPRTRVVFVSGYAADSIDDTALVGASSVFLPKPFSLTDLVETVQAQLPSQTEGSPA